jgi:hypothetical protein
VHPAPLPTGAEQDRLNSGLQPGVRIGDDQLGAVQPTGLQRAQEPGPERAGLTVTDVEAEYLTPAVDADSGGDHHGLGGHPAAPAAPVTTDPGLAEGGVEEHIRERDLGQRPVPERRHLDVEVGADPRDLTLGDPVSAPIATTRLSTLRVEVPVT